MSKAILILDMPKNCFHCKLQDWANCRIVKGCHTGDTRPDWCPLKAVPEKPDYPPINESSFVAGYNACIDEILGGAENDSRGTD